MNKYFNLENLRFTLNDVHQISDILSYDRYAEYDEEAVDMLITSVKDFADKELFPYFREMDEQAAYFEDGKVIIHPQIANIIRFQGENGYIGSTFSYEDGGSQMPHMVHGALSHILEAANNNVTGYGGLTSGAAELIVNFGSQELKDAYVPNMINGKWGGTMCLTEPQAGSSLSDISSSATPTDEGHYMIKGQKIFISGGDHEYCENFVHLYLARIEGAPSGTKGISLFVVPKNRLDENGQLISNDVTTAGDFQKMGQKSYCTTHLIMGESDNCRGWLVGEPNKGLKYMFQMMNNARIDVGLTAASTATAAYYASLEYANERPQGRKIEAQGKKNPTSGQTLIINHADVRRMLFLQKSVVEGALSLLMFCTKLSDISHYGPEEQREDAHDLLEFLTPIAKTYPADMGMISISNGLQILGGYGFCNEYVLQQYYRDIRIMSLYEGTSGIQSMDLLGRKATMKNGRALQLLMKEIQSAIAEASVYEDLKPYAQKLEGKLKDTQQVLMHLMPIAMEGDYERFLSDASVFMEFASTIVIAWQWLIMATKSYQLKNGGDTKYDMSFHESKIHTMKFFYTYELNKTLGLKETLLNTETLTIMKDKELIR